MQRVWQTSDDKSFQTKVEAQRHEINYQIKETIAEGFDSSNENPIQSVLNFLNQEQDAIQAYYKAITPPKRKTQKPQKMNKAA